MKLIITIILATCIVNCGAQNGNTFSKSSFIESYKLEVNYNKTTTLVFPAGITSVDRGSKDILVQKATGVENILRVKADVKDFTETSLSVITADGKLYTFLVSYARQPTYLNINVAKIEGADPAVKEQLIYSAPAINSGLVLSLADSVISRGSNIRSLKAVNSTVSVTLNGLYISEDVLFCKFQLQNKSSIHFDIDQLHFYIRDKKQARRTSSQEIALVPLLITGDTVKVRAESRQVWIVAFPKFTIPDGKFLSIGIMEKNGGRHLMLKVKNRHIMKAEIL